jgi:hypothetical protein
LQELDALFPGLFPPKRICIVGAGHFGYLAARRLCRRYPDASFLVVDQRRERLESIEKDFGLAVHARDTLSFLENDWVDDGTWIIPAVPVHFAYQWLLAELKKSGSVSPLPVPETVEAQVPNPYRARGGSLCASFATFICPDYCNEPDELCTYTKGPRPGNLYEDLARISLPGSEVIVVRSWQLAPGVGGYPGRSLDEVLEKITGIPEGSYLVATSCRCHGVIDGLRWVRTHRH